jgi:predicted N-formylglutamate amidohydrolase
MPVSDRAPVPSLARDACEVVPSGEAAGRWVVTCDHASNAVPDWIGGGSLGLDPSDMGRHIALDVGAAGLARALARRLGAPALLARFSRLVIDPNRGEDDPTLVMRLYDGSVVPANRRITETEVAERLDRLHRPYHEALAALLAARPGAALLAVHSFTPQLRGRPPRPWHVGVLHSHLDGRLALPLIRRLGAEAGLVVGDNEPYSGHLPGDSVDRHALRTGRPNVLVEVRNDLIATPEGQETWAARLAPHLEGALRDMEGT